MMLLNEETGIRYKVIPSVKLGHVILSGISKNKSVDMSVFIKNRLECTFSNSVSDKVDHGYLYNIYSDHETDKPYFNLENNWRLCRPVMERWYKENDFDRDVVADLRDAGFCVAYLNGFFQITGLQENFEWPWELK